MAMKTKTMSTNSKMKTIPTTDSCPIVSSKLPWWDTVSVFSDRKYDFMPHKAEWTQFESVVHEYAHGLLLGMTFEEMDSHSNLVDHLAVTIKKMKTSDAWKNEAETIATCLSIVRKLHKAENVGFPLSPAKYREEAIDFALSNAIRSPSKTVFGKMVAQAKGVGKQASKTILEYCTKKGVLVFEVADSIFD